MEPLAFVEVLGRHNDVLARHAVYHWPARVGRGYDTDVILDDRFVAAQHLRIEPAADGRFALTDLQSLNGLSLPPSNQRVSAAEVGPDDVVRLGQTQLRIRAPSYAVRAERPLRATAMYRRPVAFAIMAAVLLGLAFWNSWVVATHEEERAVLAFSIVLIFVAAGIWVSIWALVSRTVGGRSNFSGHGFVACAGLTALALWGTLTEYLSFGFDAHWLKHFGTLGAAAIFAYMVYRHLRLNSRAARRRLGIAAMIVSVTAYGVAAGFQIASESARQGVQRYNQALKAPLFLMVSGVSPEAFVAEGETLKRKVDAMARVEP